MRSAPSSGTSARPRLPTASAVLGDLISIARQNNKLNSGFVKQVLPKADILPPEEACNTYYMRFMVKDDPGVLRDLSGALSDQGVSIAQAIQKGQMKRRAPRPMRPTKPRFPPSARPSKPCARAISSLPRLFVIGSWGK